MHERYSYYRNIAYISVIFGGYVLIWYSRGDGLFDVKEIKSSARKRRISGLFRRFGFEARLLKKLGFLIWKHIRCKMCVRL